MKRFFLFLSIVSIIAFGQWRIAESKCCPPPPVSTVPIRTLPISRTAPPTPSGITLPPQTTVTPQHPSPVGSTAVPIRASDPPSGIRTTVNRGGRYTNPPSNVTTTGPNGRPSQNGFTPNPRDRTPNPSNPSFTTEIPSNEYPLPAAGTSPITTNEFAWEDWWNQNVGYLLARYDVDEKSYVNTDVTEKDISQLISLFAYRGIFDEGVREIASSNICGMGAERAVPVLAKIIQKKFKFTSKNKVANINKRDYCSLAIQALGYLKSQKSADAVAAVLLREIASHSVATVARSVDTLLLKSIKDSSEKERFWACMSLGKIGDEKYVPILDKILNSDRSKFVRMAAAEAIAMIGGAQAIESLENGFDKAKKYYQVQTYVACSLGCAGSDDPIDDIQIALESTNGDVRASATWALAYVIGQKIDEKKPFAKLLNMLDVSIKSESDKAICQSKALSFLIAPRKELLDFYSSFLDFDRNPAVETYAVLALGLTGLPKAVDSIASLCEKNPVVEKAIAYATAMLVSSDNAKVWLDIFNDNPEEDTLLAAAILAMPKFLDLDDTYKRVYRLRNHKGESKIVLRASSYFFGSSPLKSSFKVAVRNIRSREDAKSAFSMIGMGIRNTVEALDALRRKPSDVEIRKSASIAKGLMGGLPLVSALKKRITGGKSEVRAGSLVALGLLNRPEEIRTILEIAKSDPDEKARGYAIAGLANVNIPKEMEEEVISVLIKILKDDNKYFVQGYAAFLLSKFPHSRRAYEAVRKASYLKNSDISAMAIISLGMFKNPSSTKDIKNLIIRGRGTPLAYAGFIAYGMLGDKTNVGRLLGEFEFGRTTQEFEAMAFAIAKSSMKDSYSRLLENITSDDVYLREFSVKSIAMMSNLTDEARIEVIDKLKALEKDEDMQVRFFAGVARYSFGDSSAITSVLNTITQRTFFMEQSVGEDYKTLMRIVNDRMPLNYRMNAIFWGIDE